NLDLGEVTVDRFLATTMLAVRYLRRGDQMFDEPTKEPPSSDFMRFLVEVGDGDGLVRIAPLVGGRATFYQLQRLAIARTNHAAESMAASIAVAACQGWRPRDLGQARAVWTALIIADQYATKPGDDIDIQSSLDAV